MPKVAKPLMALQIKRLAKPGYHAVGTVPGLYLQVTSSSAKSWVLRLKVGDKRREIGLGKGSEFMGQYFNPFLSQVGGNMVSDMLRAQSEQRQSDEDRAIAAGAYGGSRHGVVDSMAERNFDDVLGKNLTDLYARGFDTAAGLSMADADRGIAESRVRT